MSERKPAIVMIEFDSYLSEVMLGIGLILFLLLHIKIGKNDGNKLLFIPCNVFT